MRGVGAQSSIGSQRLLVTDLYELSMAVGYLRRGMSGPATFSLFVRKLPPARGFLVAAGLAGALDYLADFRLSDRDVDFASDTLGLTAADRDALAALRFRGDVWAVPEGRIVAANEPLLEVSAPIAQAQLAETALLNLLSFQTAVATKAARCRIAAGDAQLVDFALRRTQGIDAGLAVARCSAIAGFDATSNVDAARRYGLVAAGTMAHSFVQAFETEEAAFRAFAAEFPARCTLLVDTYDTVHGVDIAARVMNDLDLPPSSGIRLDSGDLGELARQARAVLDAAGRGGARIFASGGLDEYRIAELVASGAPIDGFGVGTKMGVSADAPYLDTAYKLVQYGSRPVFKLSPSKATLPGPKQVFRAPGLADRVGMRAQPAPPGTEPLLSRVMAHGRRVGAPEPVGAARARFTGDLGELAADHRRLAGPTPLAAGYTPELLDLAARVGAAVPAPV
jgi:nicotinate phosphoribosyltransferase